MSFIRTIADSIYNPAFYRQIIERPFSYSLKYFLGLAMTLTIVHAAIFSISALPPIRNFLSSAGENIIGFYPEELEVTIQQGNASTNVAEPYFIKIPASWNENGDSTIENLVVIDTKNDFSLDQFYQYRTAAWLTKDSLIFLKDSGIQIEPLTKIENLTINQGQIRTLITRATPYLKFVTPVIFLVALFAILFSFVSKLLYVLLLALIILIIGKIKDVPLTYGKAYQIGLHAITLGLIVNLLPSNFPLLHIPFLFSILTIVVVAMNLKPNQALVVQPPGAKQINPVPPAGPVT